MKKVAIIGESCIDEYVYGQCDRVCPEAAALCFKHDNLQTRRRNYGMASNVYNNMMSLNSKAKIDIFLICCKSKIIKRRFVDNRYNSIIFREDVYDTCERIDLSEHNFGEYDCIVLSDYCKGFLLEEDIIKICEMKNKNCLVFIDTKKHVLNISKYVDFIKINSFEFKQNISDLKKITQNCDLIVTKGGEGATLYRGDNEINFTTEKVHLMDVSGAGDTFLAALVFKFLESNNMEESIIFANKCSSVVVSKFGVEVI